MYHWYWYCSIHIPSGSESPEVAPEVPQVRVARVTILGVVIPVSQGAGVQTQAWDTHYESLSRIIAVGQWC